MVKTSLPPGFRFHPTDVELVWYYLKRKITGKPSHIEAISEVQLYKFAPWDLPDKSCLFSKDLEWYFFCPRDRKYSHGSRTNRATDIGYWKPTGRDRTIVCNSKKVGMKKTLIFHLGKSPKGTRTNWVMYEFRLDSSELSNAGYTQDACVLCKIFEKSGRGPRNGEQYGAPFKEEDWEDDTDIEDDGSFPSISSAAGANSFCPASVQSVAPGVDEPLSSMVSNFEVGEPSAMTCNLEVGEPSSMIGNFEAVVEPFSMIGNFEAGEPSYVPEPFDDGIWLKQLERFLLDSSPSRSENANAEIFDSGIMREDFVQMPDVDFENVFRDFFGLSDPSCLEPTDGIALSDIVGSDHLLHHIQPQFADEHYVEIFNDRPHMLSDDYPQSDVDGYAASESQSKDPFLPDDQLPSTFENHRPLKRGENS